MFGLTTTVSSSAMRARRGSSQPWKHSPAGQGQETAVRVLPPDQPAPPGQWGAPGGQVPAPQLQAGKHVQAPQSQRVDRDLPGPTYTCPSFQRGENGFGGDNRGIRGVTWRLQRLREAVEGCLQGMQASHSVDSPHPSVGLMGGCPSPRGLCTSCFSSSCRIITPWGFLMNCRDDLAPGVMILLVCMAGILIPLDKGED